MSQQEVVLLLGTNIGDRKKNLELAMEHIEKRVGEVLQKSEILETIPLEFASMNNFLNFATKIRTELSPISLLKVLKDIEKTMGRTRDSGNYGEYKDRIIDIDIVQYSMLRFECENLEIPHSKHLNEREFSRKLMEQLNIN